MKEHIPSFICKKCKKRKLFSADAHIPLPSTYSIGTEKFKDIDLCGKCLWQLICFLHGEADELLRFCQNEIEINRERHGIDKHADALRQQAERFEEAINTSGLFDSSPIEYSAHVGRRFLDKLGVNYKINYEYYGYKFDAYIEYKKQKVDIEFDGSIHNYAEQKKRDEERDHYLSLQGITVLRLTTSDVLNSNRRSEVRTRILDALLKSRVRQRTKEKQRIET